MKAHAYSGSLPCEECTSMGPRIAIEYLGDPRRVPTILCSACGNALRNDLQMALQWAHPLTVEQALMEDR